MSLHVNHVGGIKVAEKEEEVSKTEDKEQAPGASSAETEKAEKLMVPKDRLDQVIGERENLKERLETLEAKESKATNEALAEQGKFEELYKEQLKEAEKAQGELATIKHDSLRRDVATKAGFPQFWNRIQGATEDELEADMKVFSGGMPKATAPNIDAGTKSGKRASEKDAQRKVTKEEIGYVASILNVPIGSLSDEAVRGVIENL